MLDEVDDVDGNYYNIQKNFQNNPEDIEKNIKCWMSTNTNFEYGSLIETQEILKSIVVSIYLVCKEMKYDLEVNDLFNILSPYVGVEIATNILEDILEYN